MKLERRHLWYAGGTAALAFVVFRLMRPEVITVEATAAGSGPLVQTVGDEGQTRVRNRHVVTAPLPGRLERIALEVGDPVRAGMVVARLAPLPLDARSRQQAVAALESARDMERVAEAAVGEAEAALDQARRDRQRAERLAGGGGIAPAEVERLQIAERAREQELRAAESRVRAASHDVESARLALTSADAGPIGQVLALRCPVGGKVLAIADRTERTVQPGEPLLEVGDPSDLEIVVDLLSTDAVKVSPGERMIVSGWGGDSVLPAQVRRVEPSGFTRVSALGVEEQRVNVIGDLTGPAGRLGDRFRVDVQVVLWEADSVLKVPSSALFRIGDDWALFVIDGGRARQRPVVIGHESPAETEVTGGVRAGELVIRHPTDRIRDGVRVRPDRGTP